VTSYAGLATNNQCCMFFAIGVTYRRNMYGDIARTGD
jgi:hypothetical protein